MSEMGSIESQGPDEGGGGAGEGVSEAARERFQASQAAIKQIRQEEKRAKKRDDQVAHAIIKFLHEEKYAHLFQLIAQLVARDCPSIFVLAILSLLSEDAQAAIEEYLRENTVTQPDIQEALPIPANAGNREISLGIGLWVGRLQGVMVVEARSILMKLLVDEKNIDGTVLQLTAFTFMDYLKKNNASLGYDDVQPMAAGILQLVFEPFLHHVDRKQLRKDGKDGEDGKE